MVSEDNKPGQNSSGNRPPAGPDLPEQYQVLVKINEGGMGAIFKAKNRYTGATFAIKVLRPKFAQDEEYRQRFIVEARAAGTMKHPHICAVHDFGITANQTLYLVMDWIDGISLMSKIVRDGPLDAPTALLIYQQIAMALSHAHKHGVIHRDLKPENIILSREPTSGITHAYLVDFGVAKVSTDIGDGIKHQGLTVSGTVVGTPMYMSPEQAREMEVDGRSDIYSLGCVMYFALTGNAPFLAETALDTMFKHVNETPPEINPALKVPANLKKVIFKSLEKSPADRYQSADELLGDITKIAQGGNLGKITLASEKQKKRERTITLVLFLLGFVVMYFASTMAQSFLDNLANNKNRAPVLKQNYSPH